MVTFDGNMSGLRAHGGCCDQINTPFAVLKDSGVCCGLLRSDIADMAKLLNDGS
jgi:hypothetical protein